MRGLRSGHVISGKAEEEVKKNGTSWYGQEGEKRREDGQKEADQGRNCSEGNGGEREQGTALKMDGRQRVEKGAII